MQLAHDTLVAVADGKKFTLFRTSGSDGHPALRAVANPDLGDDDAIPSGGRHHSSRANPDDATLVADGHAAAVADSLNKMALKGEITALVVVAPAKTIGELRKHWHKTLAAKIVGEVTKELTGASADEIAAVLAKA